MRRWILGAALLLVALAPAWAGRRADRLYAGDLETWRGLADAVAARAMRGAGDVDSPGGARFDGEWGLVTCQMTALGLGQVIRSHPELLDRYQPAIEACLDWMLTPEALAFGAAAWGDAGLESPTSDPDHAWQGYLNSALGMHRLVTGSDRYAETHDALSQSMAARLRAPVHRLRTYPGESYPPDQAVLAGSVGLHQRATSADHSQVLRDWGLRFRRAAVDPETGLLIQSLSPTTGAPLDHPRGSGTAIAAYFLSFSDPTLSAELYGALQTRDLLGFSAIREYPIGVRGRGDIDSGPVLLGVSVAATGFAIAGARAHGDEPTYRRLTRTATLFGAPAPRYGGRWHWTGGAIGNAILLAMMTAESAG